MPHNRNSDHLQQQNTPFRRRKKQSQHNRLPKTPQVYKPRSLFNELFGFESRSMNAILCDDRLHQIQSNQQYRQDMLNLAEKEIELRKNEKRVWKKFKKEFPSDPAVRRHERDMIDTQSRLW